MTNKIANYLASAILKKISFFYQQKKLCKHNFFTQIFKTINTFMQKSNYQSTIEQRNIFTCYDKQEDFSKHIQVLQAKTHRSSLFKVLMASEVLKLQSHHSVSKL